MKRNSTKRNLAQAGVTLIEMLVVVTIIALFAAVVGPKLLGRADEAKKVAARQQIQQFGQALGMYKLDTGQFPSTEQGLGALRLRPASVNQWNGPYLQTDLPTDPWGFQFVYKFPGDHGDEPDMISYGADGQPGGTGNNDDIVSWKTK